MTEPLEQHPKQRTPLLNVGMAAALPWAAALVLRYFWLMLPPQAPPPMWRLAPGLWRVFPSLLGEFSPGGAHFPYLPVIGGMIALWLFTLIGRLFLLCFQIYLPKWARWALAFTCGLAIVGIVFELFAIFFLLYWPVVWGVLFLMIAILWRVSYRVRRHPPSFSAVPGDARVYRHALEVEAQARYRESLIRPRGLMGRSAAFLAVSLIAAITLLTFYHALFYPESYWDSLILYLGYARMTFLQHGFPIKVVAQVGIGLGANYPHLFSLLGSLMATMFGHWSPYYQQLLAPMAGLATTLLVYHTVLQMTRRVNHALAAALLFRAIPTGIAYNVYASDYAIVMLLAAAFCYVALLYLETGLWGHLAILTLLTATGAHVNYLMNAFWALWALVVVLAHLPKRPAGYSPWPRDIPPNEEGFTATAEPEFTRSEPGLTFRQLFRSKHFWWILAVGIALTLPWHIRNWIVTGNPVVAFFLNILGGKNINPEVLQSAFQEWRSNGDGIGVEARYWYGANTLLTRLKSTWPYFIEWDFPWKLAPIFGAFVIPGFLFWLMHFVRCLRNRSLDETAKFGAVIVALLLGMLAYFYLLADFYLYQIVAIVPAMALLFAFWPLGTTTSGARFCAYLLVLCVGVMPGLAHGLMGPKMANPNLWAFHHPLIPEREFYRIKFPGEAEIIEYVNTTLSHEKLLTHDNRHLLYNPDIQLVHLDDWDVQQLYNVPSPDERADRLLNLGIHYYLRIPMEDRHPVNRKLGMPELLKAGRLKLVAQAQTPPPDEELVLLYRIVGK